MAETFENAVLKKLDGLQSDVNDIKKHLGEHDEHLDRIEKHLDDHDEHLRNHDERFDSLEKRFDRLELELKDTQEVVKMNTQILIKLETTITTKIDALFDSYSVNEDKHKEYNSHLNELDSQVFNHDIRISTLEDNLSIAHA